MQNFPSLTTAAVVCILLTNCASGGVVYLPSIDVAGTFSSIEFVEEAGDIFGVELNIVPAPHEGYQAAVQVAEGGPGPLVVVAVQEDLARPCRWIAMDLGEPYEARIEGCVEIDAFVGHLISKAGMNTPIRATRRPGYWSRRDG
jgi:hypothetical protein